MLSQALKVSRYHRGGRRESNRRLPVSLVEAEGLALIGTRRLGVRSTPSARERSLRP